MKISNSLVLNLEDREAIPESIRDRLMGHADIFIQHDYLDGFANEEPIASIEKQLAEYLESRRLRGYHCTKEPSAGYFQKHGIRRTDIRKHQREFLDQFGSQFTPDEIIYMNNQWEKYFFGQENQSRYRNGLIWACLSRSLVKSQGTEVFFRYFGGEAIWKPLADKSSCKSKLSTIGNAVVVEVAIDGGSLKSFFPMSRFVLSQFHRTLNSNAFINESECYISADILPADILNVTPFGSFSS